MWSESQKAIIQEWILNVEGGYVDDPNDPGGETKYGISKKSFPRLDIKNLTIEQALDIYRSVYWQPLALDNLNFALGFVVFDCAILCGAGWAANALKEAYHEVGNLSSNQDLLAMNLISQRIKYHTQDPNFHHFGQGWLNRVATLLDKYIALYKIWR
jgi:lysozyme family protein